MAKKLTQAEMLSRLPYEEVMKLSGEEGRKTLEGYLSTMRSSFKKRMNAINRSGEFSHAADSLIRWHKNIGQKPLKKMTRNQLLLEFYIYSSFFNAQTSSVPGIKAVNKEQDKRIFGTDVEGNPLNHMTTKQRERYWKLYEEFNTQNPEGIGSYSSESIQQFIADAVFNPKKFFTKEELDGALNTVEDRLSKDNKLLVINKVKEELEKAKRAGLTGEIPNAYMGRRDDN